MANTILRKEKELNLPMSASWEHTWDVSVTSVRDGRDMVPSGSALFIHRKENRHSSNKRLGGLQSRLRSFRIKEYLLSVQRYEPRIFYPVAQSHYRVHRSGSFSVGKNLHLRLLGQNYFRF